MDNFLESLNEKLNDSDKVNPFKEKARDHPVLAEMPISGTQLHNLAKGGSLTLADGPLGVRFMLRSSFKARDSNYIVNNFMLQIVALGKENTMRKEDIAVKTKLKTVTKEVIKKPEPKKATEVKQAKLGDAEEY